MVKNKSIEEQIEDWCKQQLQGIKYYTKTESINSEIEDALHKAPSKKGGEGNNFPDLKCFVQTSELRRLPVMIEVKGRKGDFAKFDDAGSVANRKADGEPNYNNISRYAVNGAVHYAEAILDYAEAYEEVVAIGVNGYDTAAERIYEIGVYYLSRKNWALPKKIGEYADLSFLQETHLADFVARIDSLSLSEAEIEKKRLELEDDIERKLKDINQKMHEELDIVVRKRVPLITGLVMAGLGVPGKVSPLRVEDLTGEMGEKSNDGRKVMDKISDYLREKDLPLEKIDMIENALKEVFLHSKLQNPHNGVSKLRVLYGEVNKNIMQFLRGDLYNIDFSGRLFNVLNEWVDVPDGDRNDVVLTPRYVTELMSRLCRVGKDSYVWDFAVGSAGFLISAMHQMIADAKATIHSPKERDEKILHIKMEQLMGIEKLSDIYLLAVLNMILMKDGSSNIIHGNSLTEFDGNYEQGKHKGEKFPANVFLLNPPYSTDGKGFVFVKKALDMMSGGMAAILIQENAGSGNGLPYTRDILKRNTLLASIHMSDIFCGKASVQTAIYVFRVGTPHDTRDVVKFIDFSNDGYSRQNRKKSSQNVNLRDTDNAKERYDEVVKLVVYGRGVNDCNLHYMKDCYIEDYITLDGNDWTYSQHRKIDTRPTSDDFRRVVKDYLAWRIGEIIKEDTNDTDMGDRFKIGFGDYVLSNDEKNLLVQMKQDGIKMCEFKIGDLFDIHPTKTYGQTNRELFSVKGKVPVVSNTSVSNGITNKVGLEPTEKGNMITYSDTTTSDAIFYQPFDYVGYSHVQGLYPLQPDVWTENTLLYFVVLFRKSAAGRFDYANKFNRTIASNMKVSLPVKENGSIDYELMETYIRAVKKECIAKLF